VVSHFHGSDITLQVVVFWFVTPCNGAGLQSLEGPWCLHLHLIVILKKEVGRIWETLVSNHISTRCHNPKDQDMNPHVHGKHIHLTPLVVFVSICAVCNRNCVTCESQRPQFCTALYLKTNEISELLYSQEKMYCMISVPWIGSHSATALRWQKYCYLKRQINSLTWERIWSKEKN
jgi:hypothetical protein